MPDQFPNALDPAGRFAAPLADLSWTLFVVCSLVLLIVAAALVIALFGGARLRRFVGSNALVIAGGLAFPAVVLTGLLIYSLTVTAQVTERSQAGDLRIRVDGEMWWWRAVYLDENGDALFETANEIRIPVGRAVTLELRSADVIHSFWVPQLGPKMDMIPGRTNTLRIQADRTGVFRGQCAEYCGASHALMAFQVIAESGAEHDAWAASQALDAAVVSGAGWDVFAASGCGACHTVRGTDANGRLGPDLTHVGARRTLAAGILPNTVDARRAFLIEPDTSKPGVRMPGYPSLAPADIDALNAWLGQLS